MNRKTIKHLICICAMACVLSPNCIFAIDTAPSTTAIYEETTHGEGACAVSSISEETIREEYIEFFKNNDLTPILIETKSIYVKEEIQSNGEVYTIPMTEMEVERAAKASNGDISTIAISNPDPKPYGKLTISLAVSCDARHQVWINTRADWGKSDLFGDTKYQTSGYDDTYTVTWGDSDGLKSRTASCSGNYRNGKPLKVYNLANGETGVHSWSVSERFEGAEAEKIYSTITLVPTNAYQGRTTWCEFTYIHTYVQGEYAPGDVLQWSLSIAADGLPY